MLRPENVKGHPNPSCPPFGCFLHTVLNTGERERERERTTRAGRARREAADLNVDHASTALKHTSQQKSAIDTVTVRQPRAKEAEARQPFAANPVNGKPPESRLRVDGMPKIHHPALRSPAPPHRTR